MTNIVLHIGLHKTATRFLQRAVFHNLDPQRFLVNPPVLARPLKAALRTPSQEHWDKARDAAMAAREEAGGRTLVVSDPTISGDMYSSHHNYKANLALVYELFPEAHVLYFVRRQSDWLQSAYRQALVKGKGMSVERFLNFYDGTFIGRVSRRVYGVRNVEALTLRFLEIYRAFAERFGAERVYLFRQEDLRQRPNIVYRRMAEALGIPDLPPLPERVSGNRAFSALAIRLFFSGIRAPNAPPNDAAADISDHGPIRRYVNPWRRFRTALIRHGFDRVAYYDWDLLSRYGMRDALESHYQAEFDLLTQISQHILDYGPGQYALDLASSRAESA